MEALFTSIGVVALAEIGDKTQLLAFVLAARFKKPVPIILAILCATLVNHGLAGALGAWITSMLTPETLRWAVGLSFLGMAVWTMIPDKIEEEETQVAKHLGVFGATLVTFFLAEMGDKTQIATVAMAAHFPQSCHGRHRHHLGHAHRGCAGSFRGRSLLQQDSHETGSFDRSGNVCFDGRAGAIEDRHLDQVRH